jgi:hypothetical protein
MNIPIYVPVFNNPTYTKYFVDQLHENQCNDIYIVDNKSDYPPMISLLKELEKKCNVVRLNRNEGPHYILRDQNIYKSLPDVFCLSDPDMELSKNLPKDFLTNLLQISHQHKMGKVGFALEVPNEVELKDIELNMEGKIWNMREWESQWWENCIGKSLGGDDLYLTTLDTQFALYNKVYFDPNERYRCIRVAGRFTAKHLGLYKKSIVPDVEQEFYRNTTRYSYVAGNLSETNIPVFDISVHEYTLLKEELDSLRDNNKLLAQRAIDLDKELQTFYQSRSWKVIRYIKGIIG